MNTSGSASIHPTSNQPHPATPRVVLGSLLLDLVLVVLFAVIGRTSHHESLGVAGVAQTAWPFLAGLAVAWIVGRVWRAPRRIWPHGVCVWLITVAAGMLLRILSGSTAEIAFVTVTALVLGVFLLGHRALTALIARAGRRRRTQSTGNPGKTGTPSKTELG